MPYNILSPEGLDQLRQEQPERFSHELKGDAYLNLQALELQNPDGVEVDRLTRLVNIMRGLMFCALEASQSGHPGGSSSKAEQLLSLILGGNLAFDALNPKHSGRDRIVWSAGHCSPCLYGCLALIYECLRRAGRQFSPAVIKPIFPEDLLRFRHSDGPQGHIENYYPLSDLATGASGHGFPAAGGLAILHKSCGLDTKVWTFMGDAESEEGMTYEARNVLHTVGADNLIVLMDYNHFGIDGPIEEVISSPYINHWLGLGWNVIEVDGHNITELVNAYNLAANKIFANGSPTMILAHGIKGKYYGSKANSAASHGSPAKHDEYVTIMKDLGFDIPGQPGSVMPDIEKVLDELWEEDINYVVNRLEKAAEKIKHESELVTKMKTAMAGRPLVKPASLRRPAELPAELKFIEGEKVATRKASQNFYKWLMQQTAFFYAGTGDLSCSILTKAAEDVYGIINRDNPLGRGVRFGIAEQNMAMMYSAMTQDVLPGGCQPVSVFSSYGVFTSMMSNCVRMTLIGNHLKPETAGFFIMQAAHDGPETGEDGPTHQGMFWMSLYNAYPGIKVYKPMDANETIEMLFYALAKGEPIALSVMRPDTPVLKRGNGVPPASQAINGAYVYRPFKNNGGRKVVLAISGIQVLVNTLATLPELEARGLDVKIIAVTSPELFEDLRKTNPAKAQEILPDEERELVITLHNGWAGFMYPFMLPTDYDKKAIGIKHYLKSGNTDEVYELAKLTPADIKDKVLKAALQNP